jgi:hypothetical protein
MRFHLSLILKLTHCNGPEGMPPMSHLRTVDLLHPHSNRMHLPSSCNPSYSWMHALLQHVTRHTNPSGCTQDSSFLYQFWVLTFRGSSSSWNKDGKCFNMLSLIRPKLRSRYKVINGHNRALLELAVTTVTSIASKRQKTLCLLGQKNGVRSFRIEQSVCVWCRVTTIILAADVLLLIIWSPLHDALNTTKPRNVSLLESKRCMQRDMTISLKHAIVNPQQTIVHTLAVIRIDLWTFSTLSLSRFVELSKCPNLNICWQQGLTFRYSLWLRTVSCC